MDFVNDLAGLDLNLIVALHALLEERSVTRAARRLGRSQPATSNALARLRDLLDDPLLVREGQGMVPTARALALAGPVADALASLHRAVSPVPAFDPARDDRVFRVAADDLGTSTVLRGLAARVVAEAPGCRLEIWPARADPPVDALASGELDLALGVFLDPPGVLAWRDVGRHGFAVLARDGHPALADGLSLDAYCAYPHVLVSSRGATRSVVDYVLSTLGRSRRVGVTVPQFLAAPGLLAGTDLLATVPEAIAAGWADRLVVRPPPLELPRFPLRVVWHRRHDADTGLRWLLERLSG
ncbi:MAG: LysR family transcriptional regulator [Alphaproteobacteria bacterium]|nr:LysR family transcriptional regulator [Alphaproteobacteria bacterium]